MIAAITITETRRIERARANRRSPSSTRASATRALRLDDLERAGRVCAALNLNSAIVHELGKLLGDVAEGMDLIVTERLAVAVIGKLDGAEVAATMAHRRDDDLL